MAMPVDSRASSQSIASSRLPVSGTASVSPNSANAPLTGTGQETSTASLARQSTTYDQLSGTSEWESAQGQQLQQNLSNLAHQDPAGFRHALAQAFGGKVDAATLDNLLDLALADELPMPASIQFVDAGALGESSLGAYDSADGGTLFLDRSLLSDPQQLQSVFNEEMGHHLDALLGGADAAGDEGAVFSRTLESGQLSQTELTALKSEDDHGVIQIGGRWVQVEFSQESAGNAEGESSGSSGDGGGGETGSSGGTDSGEETSSSGNTGSGGSTGDTSGAGDGGHDSGQCSADGDYGSPTRDTPDKDTPSSFENGNSDTDKAGGRQGADPTGGPPGSGETPGTDGTSNGNDTAGGDETSGADGPPGSDEPAGDDDTAEAETGTTGSYDEYGINVPAPMSAPDKPDESDPEPEPEPESKTPASTDVPHSYDEVGIDVPATAPKHGTPPGGDNDGEKPQTQNRNGTKSNELEEVTDWAENYKNTDPCNDCHGTLPDPNAVTTDADRQFMRDLGLDMTIGMTGIGGFGLGAYRAFVNPSVGTIGSVALDALPGPNVFGAARRGVPDASPSRPSWQQSELDVSNRLGPDYDPQKSFLNGVEVPYGTKGSVRPDNYRAGESVEVKNYNVETPGGRRSLERNISKQVEQRDTHLPSGTRQTIQIDVRGQNVSAAEVDDMIENIVQRSKNKISLEDFNILR